MLKNTTDPYEGDKLLTSSTSISVQPELMMRYKDSQICSVYVTATFYTSVEARAMHSPTSPKSRGARIRNRFRSINAHGEQKRLELR